MGVVYGAYMGSSKDLRAGGLSFQPSFMPHGETGRRFDEATRAELRPERVGEGSLCESTPVLFPSPLRRDFLGLALAR